MPHHRIPRRSITLFAVLATLGIAVAGAVLTDPESQVERPFSALPVETLAITLQDSHIVRRGFSGRVEPRRESVLGFESAGRLARVLVDEGTAVEAGALLATLDAERLEARRAELDAARAEAGANLRLADITLKRLRGIVDEGGVSRQRLDEAQEARSAAHAALRLAGQRIATVDVELAKTALRAPFAGVVVSRQADEGTVLDAGQPVLVVQERATPEIRIGIAGRAIDALEPGRVYGLKWGDATLSARLRARLPVRSAVTRTVDVLFEPVDPPPGLLPGDLVTVTVETTVVQTGTWVPLSALAEGERGLWSLYLAAPAIDPAGGSAATHRVVRDTVEILHHDGERAFVQGTVGPADRIIVTGLQRIVPGQSVRIGDDAAELTGPQS
jgi:RND family efflux transporter MFP subunit